MLCAMSIPPTTPDVLPPDTVPALDMPEHEALMTLLERLTSVRHRGLLWITAPAESAIARAVSLWQATDWTDPLWLGAPQPDLEAAGIVALPAAKARTRLGGEHGLVVIDAVSAAAGFDPEAFGAVSGTLRAGGLLVLLTPPDWGARPDGDYARLAEHPYSADELNSRYLGRLARLLSASPQVAIWTTDEGLSLPNGMDGNTTTPTKASCESPPEDTDCATVDQARAVARLCRLKRRRPLVLTADRGRGKSAALGIACARLMAKGETDILVTAPRPAAVEALFERLAMLCPEGARQGNAFVLETIREPVVGAPGDGSARVRFIAPDALVESALAGEQGGAGALLLVDEAAAIPAPLLSRLLSVFPRIAFATTVHGYEGSGRGFALRFREYLDRQTPGWQGLHLATPIRWAVDDPLERLTDTLLMLDAEPCEARQHSEPGDTQLIAKPNEARDKSEPEIVECSRDDLAADEPRLRALFGLLVQAHYRTQPSDLRRLLDGPGGRVVCLYDQGLRAVALTVDEGGFEPGLAEQVARGERRPRGHLLAQSLAAHAGSRAALTSRIRRVMRIAVDPGCRRLGHGQALLSAELERARETGIDLLGASFGAEAGLMAFWQRSGFRVVRLGLTREAASGEHALMVACATSPRGEALLNELADGFQALLPSLLAFELKEFDPLLAARLLAEGGMPELDASMQRDIADVALGHRAPALARPALKALVRRGLVLRREASEPVVRLSAGQAGESGLDDDAWLLVAVLFQGRGDAWLARRLGLPGRRQVEARLRTTLDRWRRLFAP